MEAKYVYISDPEKIGVQELAEIQLNNKVLKIPFYGVTIRSNLDVECLKGLINEGHLKNTAIVSYSLGDAEVFKNKIEKTLFEFVGEKLKHRPFSGFILTIDPCGEYFTRDVKSEIDKLKAIPDLPDRIKEIFNTDGYERQKLIKRLYGDESALSGITEWYLKKAIGLNAEISIPPCSPIEGQSTLKYCIKMNRIALTIQQDNVWQKSVYFPIEFKSFKDESIIKEIIAFIKVNKPSIVVFKIFNHNFFASESSFERLMLQYFLEEIYKYRMSEKALTFSLNTDVMGYNYLAQKLCGFIEPINGNYNPDMRHKKKKIDLEETPKFSKLGKYPDPLKLDEKTFDVLKVISENTKEPYPCHCLECSKYDKFVKDPDVYNRLRRKHRVYIRDTFVSELVYAILHNNLRASMFDRFSEENSKLSQFKVFYS